MSWIIKYLLLLMHGVTMKKECQVLLCYVLKRILTFKHRQLGITEFGVFSVPTDFLDLFKNLLILSNQELILLNYIARPPLWSSGQSFWLQIQRSRVRFPALPDFLSSSGSGTESTQPREVN